MITPVEARSGKGHRDENFPVASRLIHPRHREPILAFYEFVRTADDIADHATLAPQDKLALLDRLEATLLGQSGDDSVGVALRAQLAARHLSPRHAQDLLTAFRMDVTKLRYRDWDDLMGYCRYSASPVGRQLLDLHGESRDTWPPSDALCSALQVLNHLQDCAADYHALDRVYLPLDDLGAAGCTVEALAAPVAVPGLRRVIDSLLDRTEALIATARDLPPRVAARGLRWESAVIVALAGRLALRLRRGDPLATRVKLSKNDFTAAFLTGILARRG